VEAVSGWSWVECVQPNGIPSTLLLAGAMGADVKQMERVGWTQAQLMIKAKIAPSGTLVLLHDRASNRQRMAARRLVGRGLLAGPNYRGGMHFYTLTERGRTCWLRARENEGDRV
jgi:hypothetical protein